jgi:hypothetical protein
MKDAIDYCFTYEDKISGISEVTFTPDCRNIIVTSDHKFKQSIISIFDNESEVKQIKCTNNLTNKNQKFTKDGKYFIKTERVNTKDWIIIYETKNYEVVNKFKINTYEVQEIKLKGKKILVYDSIFFNILIYNMKGIIYIEKKRKVFVSFDG